MNPLLGSALISGGANLLGGGLSFLGGLGANASASAAAQMQMQQQMTQFNQQMDFAKTQLYEGTFDELSQRVLAAHTYGLSPLVTMGVPSISMPGIPTGTIGGDIPNFSNPGSGFANSMGNFGQDISRAIMATKTAEEKALIKAQTEGLVKENSVKDAHTEALKAQANFYNARALETPHFPNPVRAGHVVDDDKAYSDHAYKTNSGTMEYQASPGTAAASGSFLESILNMARNRLGMYQPGLDPARIMSDIRKAYPGAVSYREVGAGQFAPVYPEEQVRSDVREERRSQRPWPFNYLK